MSQCSQSEREASHSVEQRKTEIYQKVIVDPAMLKVMSDGRPVGTVCLKHVNSIALSDASVRQHHVSHLQD